MSTTQFSPIRTTYIVGLLFLTNVMGYIDRLALAILLPSIKGEFALTDLQLGILTGIAFTLSYAVFGIPIARLADRGNRRTVLSISVAVWSVMTALTGAANGFVHLLLARIGVGIGEAGCVPPAHSMISDAVRPERRGIAFAVHTAGLPIGSMLGLALGGWLAVAVGWRETFYIFGLAGILLAILVQLTLPEPLRTEPHRDTVPQLPLGGALRTLLADRPYFFTLCGLAFAGFAVTGLMQWLPSYFGRNFDLSPKEIGFYFGLSYGCGAMVGILAGGPIGSHWMKRDRRAPLWMATTAYICAFPLLTGAIYASDFDLAMILVGVGFAILSCPFGPIYAMVQELVPHRLRALAVAIVLLSSSLIGAGFGPLLIGYISDVANAAGYANPLRVGVMAGMSMFPFPALFYVIAALHMRHANSNPSLSKGKAYE